jgi:hypothetical protein
MSWDTKDKAAGLCVMLELLAHLKPEEIFQAIVKIQQDFQVQLEPAEEVLSEARRVQLIQCFRRCLQRSELV